MQDCLNFLTMSCCCGRATYRLCIHLMQGEETIRIAPTANVWKFGYMKLYCRCQSQWWRLRRQCRHPPTPYCH